MPNLKVIPGGKYLGSLKRALQNRQIRLAIAKDQLEAWENYEYPGGRDVEQTIAWRGVVEAMEGKSDGQR